MHLFGRPTARLERSLPDVPLLEDAAGALGARRRGRAVRRRSASLGCLSFHPRKIVTTGRGRRRDDERRGARGRGRGALRHHGWRRSPTPTCRRRGSTTGSRTSSARSASRSCAGSTSCSPRATRIAAGYAERLRGLPWLARARTRATSTAGRPTSSSVDRRDDVLAALRAEGIEAQIGTYALHRLAAYRDQGAFPGADRGVRARPRAAVPLAADRGRSRPRRRGSRTFA